MIVSFKKEEINISSKRKWFIVGIVIALLNPIFSGLVIAYAFLTEPKLRKEGKIILISSFVWAIILAYLIEWLKSGGYI